MGRTGHHDFLAIGHVSRDRVAKGFRLGGSVTYGALAALRLGLRPAVVTSAGKGVDLGPAFPDIPVRVVPAPVTTTLRNTYRHGRRSQLIESVASPISLPDVPKGWRSAPMVMLGPIVGEVSFELARSFPDSLVLASMQGWLRQWDSRGRVVPKRWDGREVLPYVDAAIVSIADLQDEKVIDAWAALAPVLIVTMGSEGSKLHVGGVWRHVAPFPTRELDPTGAGDVFAAAFLARYHRTGEPGEAARFASCADSFCVESPGTEAIPTLAQVEARLADGTR